MGIMGIVKGLKGSVKGVKTAPGRAYDDRVKQQQKDLLQKSGKTMQSVSENNRNRLDRLNKLK
jgi:hypothetical protein